MLRKLSSQRNRTFNLNFLNVGYIIYFRQTNATDEVRDIRDVKVCRFTHDVSVSINYFLTTYRLPKRLLLDSRRSKLLILHRVILYIIFEKLRLANNIAPVGQNQNRQGISFNYSLLFMYFRIFILFIYLFNLL